jgi:NADP-dependent 3-hydroxy acid dehydrogenase YdfG
MAAAQSTGHFGTIGTKSIDAIIVISFLNHNFLSIPATKFFHRMNPIIFITGATSGFGKACAFLFASKGYALILNGRREDRLQQVKQELIETYNSSVLLLPFDVQNREAVFEAVASLPEEWKMIDVLLNNAGLALGRDLFDEANLDDWDTMLKTNVNGLMYVSKAVVPFMIKRRKGHIINMGTIAGKEVYERGNGYCASKAAVDSISQAMRIDLRQHKIKVTAIHPGAAVTEFSTVRFKGDEQKAAAMYDGYQPLTAADVADIVYYTTTQPDHVCINDLVVTCLAQANSFYTFKE